MWTLRGRVAALWFACALGFAAPAGAEMRVALVIGNSAYSQAGALRNPASDAADLSASLKRLGFDVMTILDADGATLAAALAAFADKAQGADVALFWYAGHGIQFNNVNYLLPIDARLDNEFAIRRETFAFDDIVRSMEAAAKMSLVFIDACRNTPLTDRLKASLRTPERAASVGRGLARVEIRSRDTLIVFATAPGEVAEDGPGRNSPFAEAMLRHMETPGVDIEVMLKDVTSEVRRLTNERQRPERLSRLESKFMFKPPGSGTPDAQAKDEPGRDREETAAQRRQDAVQAEQDRQRAEEESALAQQRRQDAASQARAAELRKRQAEDEARRRQDEALERRRQEAEREAFEAEERRRKAEEEAALAELRRRKAEAEARAAELRARQAEEAERRRQAALEPERGGRDSRESGPPQWEPEEPVVTRSLWDHNGSAVYLLAEGASRRFHYQRPRPAMARQGARQGTLLFTGIKSGDAYSGTAYVFSRQCGPRSYEVNGRVSDGGRQVTMYGRAPRLDGTCRVFDYKDDVLVFTLIPGAQ